MNNKNKINDLNYGKIQEEQLMPIISNIFNLKLHKTKFKLSKFDFYDNQQKFLIELKAYRYSYNKYKYEVIGIVKALNNNSVFVFQHEEGDNKKSLYYIQYNKTLFDTFNKREIYTPQRGISEFCFDIPKQYLTKIYVNRIYNLNYEPLHQQSNENHIMNDMLNYNNYNTKMKQLQELQ